MVATKSFFFLQLQPLHDLLKFGMEVIYLGLGKIRHTFDYWQVNSMGKFKDYCEKKLHLNAK